MPYMLRRWIAVFVVLCLMISCCALPVFAEEQVEQNQTTSLSEKKGSEEDSDLENPDDADDDDGEEDNGEDDEDDDEENKKPEGEFTVNSMTREEMEAAAAEEKEAQGEEAEPQPEEEEPEEEAVVWERPEQLDRVPLYLQTDYPDVPYGTGSVATSGCTMACVAMVASYLTGKTILPDELANRFRHADGSHIQRMEAASICLDLKFTKTFYPYDVVQALKQGKVAIIMLESKSDFTRTQHLVVLTEILPDGRILVNDPLGSNYNKPELDEGFTYGFEQSQLFYGFSGGWIYDFYEPPEVGPTQYPGLTLTKEETDLLAKLIWREARGECFEGQQAVAEVVLNRYISDWFPNDTLTGTIMADGQFRTSHLLKDTTADELQYKAIERALNGPNILPTDVYYFARDPSNNNIWGWIGRHVFCGLPKYYSYSRS